MLLPMRPSSPSNLAWSMDEAFGCFASYVQADIEADLKAALRTNADIERSDVIAALFNAAISSGRTRNATIEVA